MKIQKRYRILNFAAVIIICLAIIYLHLYSHEKTQQIYLEQTEKTILDMKKDFLKDTVNNTIYEIDRIRKTKHSNYQKNTASRLRRLQEELDLSEEEFSDFFRERFVEDNDSGMWTALLWNRDTGEILYDSSNRIVNISEKTVNDLKATLSSHAVVDKGSVTGLFGISYSYIDEIVKEEAGELIRSRVYANDSYIWVNEVINYEGGKDYAIRRVHPNLRETEGSYLSTDMEDIRGNLPYLEELEGIKKDGEIFFSYYFKRLNSDQVSEKITYAKLYRDYNWIVAMGVHVDDIDALTEDVNTEIKSLVSESVLRALQYILLVLLAGIILIIIMGKLQLSNRVGSLKKEINMDSLTEAASRRRGEEILKAGFQKYRETGENAAIMMFDVDDLKHLNDTYGHETGDAVLKAVIRSITQIIRTSDTLIRWGGDEFIGIFPGLPQEYAGEFAQKVLSQVSTVAIPAGDEMIRATISIGFSCYKESDTGYEDVLKRADDAMYRSKRQGKNRVEIVR